MIQRKFEDKLKRLGAYFPVLGLVGPRQVGKTTLVKSILGTLPMESIYLDLELPRHLNQLSDPEAYFELHRDKCIILDEVQRLPSLFPIIRALVDQDRRPLRFIILGSASPELIRDSSESLAGRIAYVEITPFQYEEIQEVKSIEQHWFFGGFPDACLGPAEFWMDWMANFTRTYIESDLPLLGLPNNPQFTRRLLTMISHLQGQVLNASMIAKSLDVSYKTVGTYVDFLEHAYLVKRLQSYHTNSKKRLVKSPKIYVRDSGMLHFLQQIASLDALFSHPLLGSSWEGYVIAQITGKLPEGIELFYYRTQDGSELDLVLTKAGVPKVGIEIKHSRAPKASRGLMNAIMDLGTKENLIITPGDTLAYPINGHVKVCGLNSFLSSGLEEVLK
jgi:predicted AAA+ superfamily ATPase